MVKCSLTKKDLRVIDSDDLFRVYKEIAEELNTRAWSKNNKLNPPNTKGVD